MDLRKTLINAGIEPADLDMMLAVFEQFSIVNESGEQRTYRASLMLRVFLEDEATVDRLAPIIAQSQLRAA